MALKLVDSIGLKKRTRDEFYFNDKHIVYFTLAKTPRGGGEGEKSLSLSSNT